MVEYLFRSVIFWVQIEIDDGINESTSSLILGMHFVNRDSRFEG